MKKQLAVLAAGLLLLSACQKSVNHVDESIMETETNTEVSRCASYEVLQEQLKTDPGLRGRMDEIETFIQRITSNSESARLLSNGDIEIPVVFNVLYKTNAQNLSMSQLQSQIDVLNKDFSATNTDYNLAPSEFAGVRSGDIHIRFVLDQVVKLKTKKTQWSTNDAMKKSSQGGINPTDPATKLNIWVCNMGGGILGYAQFPGGNLATA